MQIGTRCNTLARMTFDIVDAVGRPIDEVIAAFSGPVLVQLGAKFGLSQAILVELTRQTGTALAIALISRCIESHRALLDAVMSPEVNARVIERLGELTATTMALKKLEAEGFAALAMAMGGEPAGLSDIVSARTGVPVQATRAWTGIVSAVLFGQLKRHVLLEPTSDADVMQRILMPHWPAMADQVDDGLASALGFEQRSQFVEAISNAHRRLQQDASVIDASEEPNLSRADLGERGANTGAAISARRGLVTGLMTGAATMTIATYALVYWGVLPMPSQSVRAICKSMGIALPPHVSVPSTAAVDIPVVHTASVAASAAASSAAALDANSGKRPEVVPGNGLSPALSSVLR
ncbi:hypothetical protein G3O06_13785 [Burkholderia sp. Ac-20345]|uniref:hypothetical protein n=1 Tax=Burkholderia sp. Ac-20345 TaxID=2703891 RepID=UPI00197C8858|nr:hypothetical protein [Burkholderia sp. Ac-20345]MBN3778617.1 hypothetical protein [Burkholderia sp. Ac-20345]